VKGYFFYASPILGDNISMTSVNISHGNFANTLSLREEVLKWEERDFPSDYLDSTLHFVAKNDDNKIVGCASLSKEPFVTFGKNHGIRIYGFAVAEEHQKQGVGTLMLKTLRAYAEETYETLIWANTTENAISFYIHNNFVVSMKPLFNKNTGLVERQAFKNLRTV
jgi:ribosomal protein S18 acetylase RimI-like enzyme